MTDRWLRNSFGSPGILVHLTRETGLHGVTLEAWGFNCLVDALFADSLPCATEKKNLLPCLLILLLMLTTQLLFLALELHFFLFIRTKFIRTLGFKSLKILEHSKNIGRLHFIKNLRTLGLKSKKSKNFFFFAIFLAIVLFKWTDCIFYVQQIMFFFLWHIFFYFHWF